jgi:hypothetical protein
METLHREGGESPFIVKDDDASMAAIISMNNEDLQYASCPVEGCGEAILFTELDSHIEMHSAEEQGQDAEETSRPEPKKPKLKEEIQTAFDAKLSYALRALDDGEESSSENRPSDRQATSKAAWKELLKMPDSTSKSKTVSSSTMTQSPKRRLGVSTPL